VPAAVRAIEQADLVLLGPGSWFSSVIPHVLVPEVASALIRTEARRALILNLAPQPGETAGFSAERHLHVLSQHAPGLCVDNVIVDSNTVSPGSERAHLNRAAAQFGAEVIYCDVAQDGTQKHDKSKLGGVLGSLLPNSRRPAAAEPERAGVAAPPPELRTADARE
jgi:uncharacterized cofD-like protein